MFNQTEPAVVGARCLIHNIEPPADFAPSPFWRAAWRNTRKVVRSAASLASTLQRHRRTQNKAGDASALVALVLLMTFRVHYELQYSRLMDENPHDKSAKREPISAMQALAVYSRSTCTQMSLCSCSCSGNIRCCRHHTSTNTHLRADCKIIYTQRRRAACASATIVVAAVVIVAAAVRLAYCRCCGDDSPIAVAHFARRRARAGSHERARAHRSPPHP